MEKKIPVRSEADPKYTWALEDVYANNDVWKADLEKARALPAQLAAYKGHLGDSAQKLLEFLQLGDGISVLFDSLYGYAQRRSDEDTANSLSMRQALLKHRNCLPFRMTSWSSFIKKNRHWKPTVWL
mgnify:CR=1 FL=1